MKLSYDAAIKNTFDFINSNGLALLFLFVAIISFIVFKDFILLKSVYLYTDIGSDSINGHWPSYTLISDYLRQESIPGWSFQTGMGKNIYPLSLGDPFKSIYYIVGRENIPFTIIFVEILKIFIATGFFYGFLKKIKLETLSSVFGALIFGFSGYIILGSCWSIFSTEALLLAMLLFSFEIFFQKGTWLLLVITFALIATSHPSNLYLQSILIFVYSIIRIINKKGFDFKKIFRFELKLALFGLLGLGLSAVFLLPTIDLILQSPRVEGESSLFSKLSSISPFAISDSMQLWTALSRTFSSDLMGTGSAFRGWNNYLEAPLFYCSSIALLLLPQVFLNISKRQKISYSIILFVGLFLLFFPYFRRLFWLFSGNYYRTFSLFFTLLLIFLSVKALNSLFVKRILNTPMLIITCFLLIVALYFIPETVNSTEIVNKEIRTKIFFLLIFSTGILLLIKFKKTHRLGVLLLFGILIFELTYLSSITVNNRKFLTSEKLKEKVGYKDYTIDAVNILKEKDSSFYRVNKEYYSNYTEHLGLNDAQYQGYYGTSCYSSFNQKYYIKFLDAFGVLNAEVENQTRWAKGLFDRPILQTFASVKYSLSKAETPFHLKFFYGQMGQTGDVKILKNNNFLPLGFTYDKYIKRSVFDSLESLQKDFSVFSAFIIEDAETELFSEYKSFAQSDLTTNLTFNEFIRKTNILKEDYLKVTLFSENKIEGNIKLEKQKLLFFSIPYDKGWTAYVNGKETEIKLVNVGFMGLMLNEGEHEIALSYSSPLVVIGLIISIISMLLLMVLYKFKFLRDENI